MIVITAGRRVDAADASAERFPLRNAGEVAERVRDRLRDLSAQTLVCSAACGADLIALKEARALGIRLRIVLPFEPDSFRRTSVVDRPGNSVWDWGLLYDESIRVAKNRDDLIVLASGDDATAAYLAANERIVEEARNLAADGDVTALIIWEGGSRGEDDVTAELMARAEQAGIPIEEVITL